MYKNLKTAIISCAFLAIACSASKTSTIAPIKPVQRISLQQISKNIASQWNSSVTEFKKYQAKSPIVATILAISACVTTTAAIIVPFPIGISCLTPIRFASEIDEEKRNLDETQLFVDGGFLFLIPEKNGNTWKWNVLFTVGWKNHHSMLSRLFHLGEANTARTKKEEQENKNED